jgi:prepilin-type N-terminal cleavage/methylation domain-containing protein
MNAHTVSPSHSRRHHDAAKARPLRRGMTLVEVIVAMGILVSVLFALGNFMAKFSQASSQAQYTIAANELAARRLDAAREQPSYAAIDTVADSSNVAMDFRTFAIKTTVTRVFKADSVDYKLITVTVNNTSMKRAVKKTTAVAAF